MEKPIVFDAKEASKYGLIESVVLQKIREGYDDVQTLKLELGFVSKDEISKAVSNLLEKKVIFQNGIKLSYGTSTKKPMVHKNSYSLEFEEIWKYYNLDKDNKGSKKVSYEKYKKSEFSELPLVIQKKIIDEYRTSVSDVKYMKHFATFLTQMVFEEYLPDECELKVKHGVVRGLVVGNDFYYMKKDGSYGVYHIPNKQYLLDVGALICR